MGLKVLCADRLAEVSGLRLPWEWRLLSETGWGCREAGRLDPDVHPPSLSAPFCMFLPRGTSRGAHHDRPWAASQARAGQACAQPPLLAGMASSPHSLLRWCSAPLPPQGHSGPRLLVRATGGWGRPPASLPGMRHCPLRGLPTCCSLSALPEQDPGKAPQVTTALGTPCGSCEGAGCSW